MGDLISRQAAIDEIKSVYEWHDVVTQDRLIEHLRQLPSADPEILACGEGVLTQSVQDGSRLVQDCISRQEAIDASRKETVSTNPDDFDAHEKFIPFMNDREISSFGKWQWANGFNTALVQMQINIERLPSAQPEIIHCKDCKYYGRADKRRFYRGSDCLNNRIATIVPDRDFCSRAEKRGEAE